MYFITDDYGTRQWAWTQRGVLSWLSVCSPRARVYNLLGQLVAERIQS